MDYAGLLIIPLLTAVLTTVALLIKESIQNNGKLKKDLKEKMLVELYNQLFTISMKYEGLLTFSSRDEVYSIDENGAEQYISIDYVEDPSIWTNAINETTELIYSKIHLLEYSDLRNWIKVRDGDHEEYVTEEYSIRKYRAYLTFLKQMRASYGELYYNFHMSTRKRKKETIEDLKKQIDQVKKNPFYEKDEKLKRINKLQDKIKKAKK
ncbi:hypothetical protein BK125_18695 [Paenibacillus odorifer]|uniref:DUF4760 domain-containing protein n=1 Tax=Paenibacillus odorifer TaxID=189426 RepID=A0ABX3GL19_9BACL|nr:hypothetical protein [Paenibacillus odorifer]OMC76512.1 hypothetical protein BK125_18695 [Paenibacillus odorifer]OMD24881.1 hypothetical protein BSO21_21465 [Paenibacillus odorifer]